MSICDGVGTCGKGVGECRVAQDIASASPKPQVPTSPPPPLSSKKATQEESSDEEESRPKTASQSFHDHDEDVPDISIMDVVSDDERKTKKYLLSSKKSDLAGFQVKCERCNKLFPREQVTGPTNYCSRCLPQSVLGPAVHMTSQSEEEDEGEPISRQPRRS